MTLPRTHHWSRVIRSLSKICAPWIRRGCALLLLSEPLFLCGQDDLQTSVSRLAADVAKRYVAPVVSGFGTSMNSGWFHRSPEARKFSFHMEFGLTAMGTFFKSHSRHFSASGKLRLDSAQAALITDFVYNAEEFSLLTYDQKRGIQSALIQQILGTYAEVHLEGATAIGGRKDSIRVRYDGVALNYTDPLTGETRTIDIASGGGEFVLPVAGLNLPAVGWYAYQLSVGTVYGTQVTFRFFPSRKAGALGTMKYGGIGIQHNPAIWTRKKLPIETAIAITSQKMTIGRSFEMTATAIGLTASKQFGWRFLHVAPYAGVMAESSQMRLRYDFVNSDGETEKIDIRVKGDNPTRLTVGVSLRALLANLNVDYSLARYHALSAGLTLSF